MSDQFYKSIIFRTEFEDGVFIFTHSRYEHPPKDLMLHYNDYEISMFLDVDAFYSVEGNVYPISHGDIILMNQKEYHSALFKNDSPYERKTIMFKKSFLSQFAMDKFNPLAVMDIRKPGQNNKIDSQIVTENKIAQIFLDIEDTLIEDPPEKELLIKTLLIQLLIKIHKVIHVSPSPGHVSSNIISSLIQHINKDLSSDLSYENLSKMFYINRQYLYQLFKKQTGFKLHEYITNKRITKARELLIEGTAPSVVPDLVGFNDYSNFYRAFKKITGMTPKEFVRKNN